MQELEGFSDLPLRTEPVIRDEVYIDYDGLQTMPLATYRLQKNWYLEGDPALWQPLLDALAPFAALRESIALEMGLGPCQPVKPRFWHGYAFETVCPNCGVSFLARHRRRVRRVRLYLCSNRCAEAWPKRVREEWREDNPPDYTLVNAARTAKRAKARAGRQCAYAQCDNLIDAERSTRRFCSDRCRVAHHRAVTAEGSQTR